MLCESKMSTNSDRILETLRAHPKGACDACLLKLSGVKPHAQVFQISTKLANAGSIRRVRQMCPQKCSTREKWVNFLRGAPGSDDTKSGSSVERTPGLMEQTHLLSDYLDGMAKILDALDESGPELESFAARVARLRGAALPEHVAGFMLTLNALRVRVVKRRKVLTAREWEVAKAAWEAINEWEKGGSVL